jgi:hypothetical protein
MKRCLVLFLKGFLFLLLSVYSLKVFSYPWPMDVNENGVLDDRGSLKIDATLGEDRGKYIEKSNGDIVNTKHLHTGVDINATSGGNSDAGKPVLAIEAGKYTIINPNTDYQTIEIENLDENARSFYYVHKYAGGRS